MKKSQINFEKRFSNQIYWYNFILCVLVVLIHSQNITLFTKTVMIGGRPLWNQIEMFIVSDIASAAVGGFYLCSGYLFYRNYSWRMVIKKYKSRIRSVLIPYVLWTMIYYFLHVIVSRIPKLGMIFNEPQINVTCKGVLDAIVNYRYCAFLWFLQFLIVFVAFSPVIYLLIKNRYVGGVTILAFFLIAGMNDAIIKNVQVEAMINWLCIYITGGYIGIHGKKWVETKKIKPGVYLCFYIAVIVAYVAFKKVPSILGNIVYFFVLSVGIWCTLSILPLPLVKDWQKNTFAVYMTHFLVVQAVNVIISKFVTLSMGVGIILFFTLPGVCFAVVSFLKYICGCGNWKVWKLVMGSR